MKVSYGETKLKIEKLSMGVVFCDHNWVSHSGFYVVACPSKGLVQLEVCPDCGAVRLPNGAESWHD